MTALLSVELRRYVVRRLVRLLLGLALLGILLAGSALFVTSHRLDAGERRALLGVALAPAAIVRGTTEGVNLGWLRAMAGLILRGGALAALAAAVGVALASIGRNTAAALGVAFGYIAVIEPILRAVRPKWQPWLVYDNVATFIVGHAAQLTVRPRTPTGAGLLVGVYVAALAVVAAGFFLRRD